MQSVLKVKALSRFLRPRASAVSLTLGLRRERLLEVFGVNARLGPLLPGHLWSLRPVHFNELRLCRASGEGEEARALGYVRTSRLRPHLLSDSRQ
jgi:hypothetical protein